MFDRINRLFKSGKLNINGVYNAIAKGFIKRDDFEIITGTSADRYEKSLQSAEPEAENAEEETEIEQ